MTASVPEGFRLPWSNRTMADVWAVRSEHARKANAGRQKKMREKFVAEHLEPRRITASGKIAFAGYDKFERL